MDLKLLLVLLLLDTTILYIDGWTFITEENTNISMITEERKISGVNSGEDPLDNMLGSLPLYHNSKMKEEGKDPKIHDIPSTPDSQSSGWREENSVTDTTRGYLTGQWTTRLVPSVYTLVVCVALPLNVMAVIIFLFKIKVGKPAVVYMLNLATADVLSVILLPFIIIYRFNGNDWLLGEVMCRIVIAAFYCNMYCSVLLMTSISVDRFLAVVYAIHSLYWRTTTRAWVACIFIWIVSISGTVPLLITEQTHFIDKLNTTTCHDVLSLKLLRSFYVYYFTTYISLFFFLPLIITTFCYIGVIRKLSSSVTGSKFKKSRAVVLSVTVLCEFVLCFGPNNIIFLIHYLGHYNGTSEFLYFAYVICACISSISCCLDPLIYYYGSSNCQKYLQSLMSCKMNSGSKRKSTSNNKSTE